MNVLYILADRGHDLRIHHGPRVHVMKILQGLKARGHHPFLLTINDHAQLPGFEGYDYLCVPHRYVRFFVHRILPYTGTLDSLNILKTVQKLHRSYKFDVIHERYGLYSYGGILASRLLGIPLALEVNAPLIEEKALFTHPLEGIQKWVATRISKLCFTNADSIIAVSAILKQHLIDNWSLSDTWIGVLPNAADVPKFIGHFDTDSIRRDIGIRSDALVVGYLGTLQVWYGIEDLLEAFQSVARNVPSAILLIIGDGQARGGLEELSRRLGLEDRVKFLGHIDHETVPGLLSALDIAVAPFRPISTGFYASAIKIFEYMAAGKPIVASRIGQISEILRHGKTALLVEPGNVKALSQAILELAGDPDLRSQLGIRARTEIEQKYSWSIYASRLETIYRSLKI